MHKMSAGNTIVLDESNSDDEAIIISDSPPEISSVNSNSSDDEADTPIIINDSPQEISSVNSTCMPSKKFKRYVYKYNTNIIQACLQ